MSILAAIGWVVAGAVAAGVLVTFWDEIRNWLNNVAADFVERQFGYGAREKMHKAITTIDKMMDKVRNNSIIYTKRNKLDTYFDKTTIISEASVYNIDEKVLNEIKQKGKLVQEFTYMQ